MITLENKTIGASFKYEDEQYNFTNVKPAEVDSIIQHCETCVGELKAAINA